MNPRLLHEQGKRRNEMAARFVACTVLVSAIFSACKGERKPPQEDAPGPGETEIPHFIPPKQDAPAHTPAPARDSGAVKAGDGGMGGDGGAGSVLPYEPAAAGCPANMGRFGAVCTDRFEITLLDKRSGSVHPYFVRPPYGMEGLIAISEPGVFPQGYLSQEMLGKACANAGKRLCTRAEWQAACMGGGSRKYPYGNTQSQGACNNGKREPHILDKYFPDVPHMQRTGKHFNDPALLQDPDFLERTGSRKGCRTPEGIYDMDGNLSEWVSDTVQKPDGLHGTFAGDAFSGAGKDGCGRWTSAHVTNYHDYSMGGRCCADAKR